MARSSGGFEWFAITGQALPQLLMHFGARGWSSTRKPAWRKRRSAYRHAVDDRVDGIHMRGHRVAGRAGDQVSSGRPDHCGGRIFIQGEASTGGS